LTPAIGVAIQLRNGAQTHRAIKFETNSLE
jgi:hypothetical protein